MTTVVTSPGLHMAAHVVLFVVVGKVGWDVWRYHRYVVQRDDRIFDLEDRVETLEDRLDEAVHWLWDFVGEPMPDVTPATTELPAWTPPDTTPVEKLRYIGQHRA